MGGVWTVKKGLQSGVSAEQGVGVMPKGGDPEGKHNVGGRGQGCMRFSGKMHVGNRKSYPQAR